MITIGGTNITKAYLGSTELKNIAIGDELLLSSEPLPYLKFTALEDGTFKHNTDALEYSLDEGKTWVALPANTDTPIITTGNSILWRGTMTPAIKEQFFVSSGRFDASGNPLSLKYKDNFVGATPVNYGFYRLFQNCTNLVNAKDIIIPNNLSNVTNHCMRMFEGCTSLISTPELPATTLGAYCYQYMFYGCTSLVVAPELPATTLANGCYYSMFFNCINLITPPPVLPAISATTDCYRNMFQGCTALTSIPDIYTTNQAGYSFSNTFYQCKSLASVTLREGLTIIGGNMFYQCTELASIYIPSTVSSISTGAFNGCSKLKTVNISNLSNYLNITLGNSQSCPTYNQADLYLNGEKVTEVTLSKADTSRFYGCTSLQKVTWSGTITTIATNVFAYCTSLVDITIPSTVTTIGTGAFRSTKITSIVIPEGVTVLNQHTFHSCGSLESITIPSTITEINDNCFYGIKSPGAVHITDLDAWCRISFKSVQIATNPLSRAQHLYLNGAEVTSVIVPNNVTILRMNFEQLRSLTSVTLPEGLTTIDFYSFYYCTGLTQITIPSTVTTIGQTAFQYCSHITRIELPSGVTSIDNVAFANMPAMTEFICNAVTPPTLSNTKAFASTNNAIIYVPDDSVDAYKGATNWSTYASRIKGISELPTT